MRSDYCRSGDGCARPPVPGSPFCAWHRNELAGIRRELQAAERADDKRFKRDV